MTVRILTGQMMKQMIQVAQINLTNNKEKINQLNVFPVPDGDTGTNMSLTMDSGLKEVNSHETENVSEIVAQFSRGLLMGARGNSGVILSQIFRGFSSGLQVDKEIEVSELINALTLGVTSAYKAVTNPVEGTILTVAKEAAEGASQANTDDIIELMEVTVEEARASLDRTPDLLPVLKEVGVVDSGGKGLLVIYEGFLAALKGEEAPEVDSLNQLDIKIQDAHERSVQSFIDVESIEYGYCTEFMVDLESTDFDEDTYRSKLSEYGDSLLVAADDEVVKVHIHSENPGDVMTYSQQYGELMNIDIENMRKQHEAITKNDGPVSTEVKDLAKIVVSAGTGINSMFESIGADYVIEGGQTMNPSTEDIVDAIHKVNAKEVYIFPNNKNIILSAEQSVELVDVQVHVVPTKSIPQGIAALFVFDEEEHSDTNLSEMKSAIKEVKTGMVTYAIRDTKVNDLKIKKNDYIGLNDDSIQVANKNKVKAIKALLASLIDDDSEILTVFYGDDLSDKEKAELEKYAESEFSDVESEFHVGNQPVYSIIAMVE